MRDSSAIFLGVTIGFFVAMIYWHVSGDSMRVELMRMLEDYGTK